MILFPDGTACPLLKEYLGFLNCAGIRTNSDFNHPGVGQKFNVVAVQREDFISGVQDNLGRLDARVLIRQILVNNKPEPALLDDQEFRFWKFYGPVDMGFPNRSEER